MKRTLAVCWLMFLSLTLAWPAPGAGEAAKPAGQASPLPASTPVAKGDFWQQNDCVRAIPEPILDEQVYPGKTFRLDGTTGVGTEKAKLTDDLDLTIQNAGCEYFCLNFIFSWKKQPGEPRAVKAWYVKAARLLARIEKGNSRAGEVRSAMGMIKARMTKPEPLKFGEELSRQGIIREDIMLMKEETNDGRVNLSIAYCQGPL